MTSLRFLADMNLSPATVADLREQGWDILRVSQVLPMDTEDSEILEFARQQNRVIVTQDLDFSELVALGGYARPSLITPAYSSLIPRQLRGRCGRSCLRSKRRSWKAAL